MAEVEKVVAFYCEPCLLAMSRGKKRTVIGVRVRRGGLPGAFLHAHFEVSLGTHWPFVLISACKWIRFRGKAAR